MTNLLNNSNDVPVSNATRITENDQHFRPNTDSQGEGYGNLHPGAHTQDGGLSSLQKPAYHHPQQQQHDLTGLTHPQTTAASGAGVYSSSETKPFEAQHLGGIQAGTVTGGELKTGGVKPTQTERSGGAVHSTGTHNDAGHYPHFEKNPSSTRMMGPGHEDWTGHHNDMDHSADKVRFANQTTGDTLKISEPKPSLGEKVLGKVEQIAGKISNNPALEEKGIARAEYAAKN